MLGLHWVRRLVVGIGAGWGIAEREKRGGGGSSVALIGHGMDRGL